jgi:predicted ester cyclase
LFDKFWTGGDAEVMAYYMADGYVDHVLGHKSVEDWVAAMAPFRTGMPDLKYTVDLMIAEGELVSSLWTATATHTGEFLGIQSTGKRITFTGCCTARFRDGKLIEEWSHPDIFGLMKQVGAIPERTPA